MRCPVKVRSGGQSQRGAPPLGGVSGGAKYGTVPARPVPNQEQCLSFTGETPPGQRPAATQAPVGLQ